MKTENNVNTSEHREKGRGRRAFWIVLGLLFLVSVMWTIGGPRRDSDRFFSDPVANQRLLDRTLDVLDASAGQRAAIEPVIRRLQSEIAQMREEGVSLRNDFLDALDSEVLRPEDMERLQVAAVGLSETAVNSALEALTEAWGVLTPDQRTELLSHWNPRS